MSNIFNPNPQEIKIEAAHVEAIKEDAMQTCAAAMRADAAADIDKEYTKRLARIEAEKATA